MAEKHHMDQNPYISSLCPKLRVITYNMTRGNDVAQSMGLVEPNWGRSAKVWRVFEIHFHHVSS
jgi:hypothetical protein